MPRSSSPLPDWLGPGPFRVKDAQAKGVGEERMRSPDLSAPFRGLRVVGPADESVLGRCAVYAEGMPPGQFFSHRTAARILGLPLPWPETKNEPLHVCVYRPDRAPRMKGIVGHDVRVDSIRTLTTNGWFVADAIGVFRQLSNELRLHDLVALGDAIIRGPRPLASLDQLRATATMRPSFRGIATVRDAVPFIRAGSESPRESRLRMVIVGSGLPEPELNVDVHDALGRFLGRGDMVYPHWKVLVEYDGDQHRTEQGQYRRDVDRLEGFTASGWQVVRVLNHHLSDEAALVRRIRDALIRGGWRS